MKPRKGSSRIADIPPEILEQLNAGTLETATLAESLAIDFVTLMQHAVPELKSAAITQIQSTDGITKRMATAGMLLFDTLGLAGFERLADHPADMVRGWAAYLLAAAPSLDLPTKLQWMRPLADDRHFGVREWAWLALRPQIAADVPLAIDTLVHWVDEESANLRRFAIESTRPCGVWCPHIKPLKANPDMGMPLLNPVKSDASQYVQDSVANWLNDAAKSRPDWVRQVCDRWQHDSQTPETARICKRALRNLKT